MTMSSTPRANRAGGFLARWSRRKLQGPMADAAPPPQPDAPRAIIPVPPVETGTVAPAAADPPPTRAELDALDPGADLSRFIARGVDEDLRRAALRKLFADPQFNVMDGLDVYIDDYNVPSPMPPEVLRRLQQAAALGLAAVDDMDETPEPARTADPVRLDATPGAQNAARDGTTDPNEPT